MGNLVKYQNNKNLFLWRSIGSDTCYAQTPCSRDLRGITFSTAEQNMNKYYSTYKAFHKGLVKNGFLTKGTRLQIHTDQCKLLFKKQSYIF